MTAAFIRSATRKLRCLAGDERGVSAVEFAMLLPLMVTLYLGTVEVTLTARTVADLVAQVSSINNANMTNSLNAASAVILPFSTSNLKVKVTSVKIDGDNKITVDWSDALNDTARSKGDAVTLPGALVVPNTSVIWAEVQYSYKPAVGYIISGTLNLKEQIYMRPRVSDSVNRVNS
jgi:Flp pilus assembly protein TadG